MNVHLIHASHQSHHHACHARKIRTWMSDDVDPGLSRDWLTAKSTRADQHIAIIQSCELFYTGKCCHLGKQWHKSLGTTVQSGKEQAFVHHGSSGLNHAATSNRVCHMRACPSIIHHLKVTCKCSWQWLVYYCLIYLAFKWCVQRSVPSLAIWQITLWRRVASATAILSGTISPCIPQI